LGERGDWRKPLVRVRLYVEGGPKGADADGARNFRNAFKQHFQQLNQGLKVLPPNPDIEAVSKSDILAELNAAVKPTPDKRYHKVQHGEKILAKLKPGSVSERSRHAKLLHAFLLDSLQS
jgi:hypothetical protein